MKPISFTSLAVAAILFSAPVLSCATEGKSCKNAAIGDRQCGCGNERNLLQCATANGKTWLKVCECGKGNCKDGKCPGGTEDKPCS